MFEIYFLGKVKSCGRPVLLIFSEGKKSTTLNKFAFFGVLLFLYWLGKNLCLSSNGEVEKIMWCAIFYFTKQMIFEWNCAVFYSKRLKQHIQSQSLQILSSENWGNNFFVFFCFCFCSFVFCGFYLFVWFCLIVYLFVCFFAVVIYCIKE